MTRRKAIASGGSMKIKTNLIGHIVKWEGLFRDAIERRMDGKRPRGRPITGMIGELIKWLYVDMKRRAQNREKWRVWTPMTCREAEKL